MIQVKLSSGQLKVSASGLVINHESGQSIVLQLLAFSALILNPNSHSV
jgi:hypothetical protein